MNLKELQERLDRQYACLRDLRASENFPVYAIEHGLNAKECSQAIRLLNEQLATAGRPSSSCWLVWVAAAAEIGYQYEGAEYWHSFLKNFPSWSHFGDRNFIRQCYKKFADEFRSRAPSGPWARQFPIIAWPITQAILPKYLQRSFADHLYDHSYRLARNKALTLNQLGDFLCGPQYSGTSRFEGFLQQKTLAATLVMAIQQLDVPGRVMPIENLTLRRIVADLEDLGAYSVRMDTARRVLRDTQFINSYRDDFRPGGQDIQDQATKTHVTESPKVIAYQMGNAEWQLALVIPDLASVIAEKGMSARDLEVSRLRFRVWGSNFGWSPGRALLSYKGDKQERLARYPTENIAVFEFQNPLPELTRVLFDRLALSHSNLRVLKVRADGTAFEVAGKHVRASQSYLLVSDYDLAANAVKQLGLKHLRATTHNVHLWQFDVPRSLDKARIDTLHSLGLGYSLKLRVEPVGLTPRWNVSNASLVTLDTEELLLSVMNEVSVKAYHFFVDGKPVASLGASSSERLLVSLGKLALGQHKVVINAAGAATGVALSDELLVETRSALPWPSAIAGKAGVSITIDPPESSLVQFLDGVAQIKVIGPPGREIVVSARLYEPSGAFINELKVGTFKLPMHEKKISEAILAKVGSEAVAENLEKASRVEIFAAMEEFGRECIRFEKHIDPLRWVRVDNKIVLSDDTDGDVRPTLSKFSLLSVEKEEVVDYQSAVNGIDLDGTGALLIADHQGNRYEAIVTSRKKKFGSFEELKLSAPACVSDHATDVGSILKAIDRWCSARRLVGPMANTARRLAIHELETCLETRLCGTDWTRAVAQVKSSQKQVDHLYKKVYFSLGFASSLSKFNWNYAHESSRDESEFIRLVGVYRIGAVDDICRLALKLAFAPAFVGSEAITVLTPNLVKDAEPVFRGAYFVRLVSDPQYKPAVELQ